MKKLTNTEGDLIKILGAGDLRSAGKTDATIKQGQSSDALRKIVFSLLDNSDRLVRMRAGDILEKITKEHTERLTPHRSFLLKVMQKYDDKELRWHLVQLAGRTAWTPVQRKKVISLLKLWYRSDPSNIVKVFSMQVLFDFGVFPNAELHKAARSATFSIRARARILLST
jgi:hypothetical protein